MYSLNVLILVIFTSFRHQLYVLVVCTRYKLNVLVTS